MKRLDTDTLKVLLRRKEAEGAFVLYGSEDYLKILSANRIVSAFVPETSRDFDYTEIFGDFDLARLRDLTMALPMLSEKRVVLVRDADIFNMNAEDAERLAKLISELPSECVLIFVFVTIPISFIQPKKPDKKVTRAQTVFADATAVSCDKLSESKAVAWITSMLAEKGVSIERPVAAKLAEVCGNDMYSIKNNCDMLAACGEKEVSESMLGHIECGTVERDTFALADAIAQGEYDEAYRLLDELAHEKVDPRELMPTVLSGFTAMYRVAVAKEATGGFGVLNGEFTYTKGDFPLRRASSRLKGRPTEYFRRAVEICADAERRLKRDFAGYEAYYEMIGGLAALDGEYKAS